MPFVRLLDFIFSDFLVYVFVAVSASLSLPIIYHFLFIVYCFCYLHYSFSSVSEYMSLSVVVLDGRWWWWFRLWRSSGVRPSVRMSPLPPLPQVLAPVPPHITIASTTPPAPPAHVPSPLAGRARSSGHRTYRVPKAGVFFPRRTLNDGEEKTMNWDHRGPYLKNQ